MSDTAEATGFLHATRAFYDAIAEDYAEHFRGDLEARPLERAVLTAFAEQIASDGLGGEVADLGCGPGRVTALLHRLGLPVFGVDLSASMLAVARRENPHLRFEQGSILELDLPDGVLAGALSWYSSIHTPEDRLPGLFAEFHRVLAPGGRLLVAFQAGEAPLRLERPFGRPVTLDFQRRRPEHIEALLTAAGFAVQARLVREPDETLGETAPQAFLTARKPPATA
ncbi:class I SAM-dependent DNA methyltransferase [Streptomyces thermodiastaticus]